MVTFPLDKVRSYTPYFFLFVTQLILGIEYCNAQDQATFGKDFWLGYPPHSYMYNADGTVNTGGGSQEMRLYLSSSSNTTVKIEMPAIGWSQTITISANTLNSDVVIPKNGINDARVTGEGLFNTGIHISSDNPINAYCHIYAGGSSASSLLIPYEILGQDYYTLGAKQQSPDKNSFSYCFVVASDDSTLVEITPSVNTVNHAAGVPFTQMLKKGQIFSVTGKPATLNGGIYQGADLTGTRVRTLSNGVGACKKIAVFCGSSSTLVSCTQTGTADNIFQQSFPFVAWSKYLFGVPTMQMGNNAYRILVSNPNAKVYVNRKLITGLINGMYYEFTSSEVINISSSSPIMVAQFITSAGQCGNNANGNNGDPEMIYLSSYQISDVGIKCPSSSSINTHFVNVVIRTIAVDSFTLDNANMRPYFKKIPTDTNSSYAQIPLTVGAHILHTDTLGFAATVYGYGPNESYGYNAGFYIRSLSGLTVKNPYSKPVVQQACKTVPFKIMFAVKRKAAHLNFDFGNNKFLSPNNTVDLFNPIADSVYYAGTDTFYRYTLPATYTYAQQPDSTSLTVNITLNIFTNEGCIEQRTVKDKILLLAKPTANISLNYNSCGNDTLKFKDSSVEEGGYFTDWIWRFGDGTTSQLQNPVKKYNTYGTYKVALRAITDAGCFADTSQIISLNPKPTVNFFDSGLHCTLSNIKFIDSATIIPPWKITKWQWSFGDGGVSSDSSPVKQYNNGGTYLVKLVAYSDKSCVDSAIKSIKIYGVDTFKEFITVKNKYATPSPATVCRQQAFYLSVTFTQRQQEIVWDFSANPQLSPAGNTDVKNPVPDSLYFNGTDSFFRYSLLPAYTAASSAALNIKITSFTLTKGGCVAQTIFNNVVQVVETPVADWSLNYNKCSNDTLYFKDASVAAGSAVSTWQWQFGDNTTSSNQNPVKKYAAFGDYAVALHITTNIGCYADTVKPVSLSPKPVAIFGVAGQLYCPGSPLSFTDSSTVTSPWQITKWQWAFGDGSSSNVQNPSFQYTLPGSYTISLVAITDHNCADTATKTVNIYSVPTVTLPSDLYIFSGGPYQITPVYTGTGLTYLWTPLYGLYSDTAVYPVTTTDKNITYKVVVTGNGGCNASASVNIHVEKLIIVPNAFSPNGDGINDKWIITNIEGYPNCTVRIFNRYGQMIFSSVGYNTPWDGNEGGKPMPVGTYYYIIDTKTPQFPGKAGFLELLR